jgi:hypothetical protein
LTPHNPVNLTVQGHGCIMMTEKMMKKTLLSSLGYGLMVGVWFGVKYHSIMVWFVASVLCTSIYASVMVFSAADA